VDGGRWLRVDAPLDYLPLYVRGGAILPLAEDMDYIKQRPWDVLTLEVYPYDESTFTLHDEDERIVYRCAEDDAGVTLDIGENARTHQVVVYGMDRVTGVSVNGATAHYEHREGAVTFTVQGGASIRINR
jgi:alpha-glucosidase (family GH31 glycosyl hydrolase)